jgi:hypothetical protein
MLSPISQHLLDQTLSWDQYYALSRSTGNSADNIGRMNKILSTINIESKLYNIMTTVSTDLTWLALAAAGTHDVAEVLPVLYTIASCSDRITFRILQSDLYPEASQFLVSGNAPTIRLICLRSDTLELLGSWVPRPSSYEGDKTLSIQEEFIDLVREWTK